MGIKAGKQVGLSALNDEMNAALGIRVALVMRGDDLSVVDTETGKLMEKLDEAAVRAVIDAHVFVDPDTLPSPVEVLVTALESASTVAALKAALLGHFDGPAKKAAGEREKRLTRKKA